MAVHAARASPESKFRVCGLIGPDDYAAGDAGRGSAADRDSYGTNNDGSAICGNDQRKIGDVAGGRAGMSVATRMEVSASRLEISRIAFRVLMNVNGVRTGREILEVQGNFDPGRGG